VYFAVVMDAGRLRTRAIGQRMISIANEVFLRGLCARDSAAYGQLSRHRPLELPLIKP